MRPWQKVIPPEDRALYQKAGFGVRLPWGQRPNVLIIDVTLPFLGERVETSRALEKVRTACGDVGWTAIPHIQRLLATARQRGVPVVYVRPNPEAVVTKRGLVAPGPPLAQDFPPEILPQPGELVVEKPKASAFFETSLHHYLRARNVDSLLVAGVSTSGCVRASVVDAFSHGYKVFLVEECTFDRSPFAHAANLFDMQAKYADVVSLEEALAYLSGMVGAAHGPALGETTSAYRAHDPKTKG